MPWPDCAPCHSLPDGGGGNRPPSGQPNVPANSRQSGLRVPLAASSPRYLALTNIRRRSQSLPAATEDRHRLPSTPNRARTIALPCPYRPFRCCIVIPSVDLGLGESVYVMASKTVLFVASPGPMRQTTSDPTFHSSCRIPRKFLTLTCRIFTGGMSLAV